MSLSPARDLCVIVCKGRSNINLLWILDYTGNKALTGLCSANIALFVGMKLYYVWRNRVVVREYQDLPEAEKQKAIDSRFAH